MSDLQFDRLDRPAFKVEVMLNVVAVTTFAQGLQFCMAHMDARCEPGDPATMSGDFLWLFNMSGQALDIGATVLVMHPQRLDNRPYEVVESESWEGDDGFRQAVKLERLYLKSELGLQPAEPTTAEPGDMTWAPPPAFGAIGNY